MKPINEKERTTAFIQFIALLTVTLILAMSYVLVNCKTFIKERDQLRIDLKFLKDDPSNDNSQLVILVDSVKKTISDLDKMDNANFEITESILRSELLNQLVIKGDTNDIMKIRKTIKDICDKWIIDKKRIIDSKMLEDKIKRKDAVIEKLGKALLDKGVQPEIIDNITEDNG